MKEFYVIDVETANPDYSTICQIGIAKFENGELTETWETLINPEVDFEQVNINKHGIEEPHVQDAPTFPDFHPKLKEVLSGNIVIHHTAFDRVALSRACEYYNLEGIEANWIDSSRIVRRVWEQFSHKGFGLDNIADLLNIKYKAHHALEDAVAAGKVVVAAVKKSGVDVDGWLEKLKKRNRKSLTYDAKVHEDGNPDGVLFGETMVFTGTISIPRIEAVKMAANLGCNVRDGITKETTLLVVGMQDPKKTKGQKKSGKQKKAEKYIDNGQNIRILSEKDFLELLKLEDLDN